MIHHISKIKRLLRSSSKINKLAFAGMFGGLGFAFYATIWAVYLKSFVESDALIGFISGFLVLISFLSFIFMIPVIEKNSKRKLFILSSTIISIGFFIYFFINDLYIFLFIETILAIFFAIKVSSFGLIVECNSKRRELSKNEGLIYSFLNLSYVIGPLVAGFILARLGANYVFLGGAFLIAISVIIFKSTRLKESCFTKIDGKAFKNFKSFFKNKNRLIAYTLGCGMSFWWSLIYIYMPLLIIETLGASKEIWIGLFLAAIPLPLIFLEYYFGVLSSKKGFKKIFFIGYIIPAIVAFACLFFYNIWFILGSLIFASIGLAMTESTTEAYFFDILKKDESQRYYSIYNTALDTGSLFGKVIPAIFLLILPFRTIFIIYALGMLGLAILSLKIKEIVEVRRK